MHAALGSVTVREIAIGVAQLAGGHGIRHEAEYRQGAGRKGGKPMTGCGTFFFD